jgi:CCR4-NOT transcriptional regulation complex NOT5 subunit
VQEGVEQFDEIWEKVYSAQNQNQKEKFESELKAQIKKLQRYRDDIKTWIANSDIKDKRPLMDARKLIETEMERFKVCEKEFKTKAFSKEGLASAPKEDPKEKEKNKTRKWVGTALDNLQESKDKFEAELETIGFTNVYTLAEYVCRGSRICLQLSYPNGWCAFYRKPDAAQSAGFEWVPILTNKKVRPTFQEVEEALIAAEVPFKFTEFDLNSIV